VRVILNVNGRSVNASRQKIRFASKDCVVWDA
jgi:hypothetical protein